MRFPDPDTERAVRLGASWPGSIEDDIARWPADTMFDPEPCAHDHVIKDDDGRDNWFYVCDDCDTVVHLTEPDEDGQSHWEAVE